jgi:subtilisin family serine protease
MCNTVPGQVLIGGHATGPSEELLFRVLHTADGFFRTGVLASEDERVRGRSDELAFWSREGQYHFRRFFVAEGFEDQAIEHVDEVAWRTTLDMVAGHPELAEYFADPAHRVISQPLHYLRPQETPAGAAPFSLSDIHYSYLSLLGVDPNDRELHLDNGARIAVLDGGFGHENWLRPPEHLSSIEPQIDIVGSTVLEQTAASVHGTLVAAIIATTSPGSKVFPVRVYGASAVNDGGIAEEWHVLAGLREAIDLGAHVINLSIGFDLEDHECKTCGRMPGSSRSAALEMVIDRAVGSPTKGAVVVCAAGNNSMTTLDFPARFVSTVAITSVNSHFERSSFSNYDRTSTHPWLFALPGGDSRHLSTEVIAESAGRRFYGTSFACAYASGLLARATSYLGSSSEAVRFLADTAYNDFEAYDQSYHGHGIMRSP